MTVASLNTALSGLKAAQKALDTISSNISNAGTEGYTRKILPQETLVTRSGEGLGVRLAAITRNVDQILLRDLAKQTSVSTGRATTLKYLDRIQDFNGASENGQSLSARISALSSAFTQLSDTPDSLLNINKTLSAARLAADKFNEFSGLLTQMRNETESEIASSVNVINSALETIAALNIRINSLKGVGESTATLEDQRDMAINTVSKYIQISSFPADNGKIVVMTKQGQTLADESARTLSFQKSNLLPTSYYAAPPAPSGGAEGLFIGGPGGIEITASGVGGSIGALLELRDDILPTYTAQIDEMAQKLAFRLDQQGLRLFTDSDGSVPPNAAPPGPVGYVGFAARIRVNQDVLNDPSLIRSGTTGNTVLPGSNEVIRKVAQFAFGAHAYEQARGTADISAGAIYGSTGMQPVNRVIGNTSIVSAAYTPTLDTHPDIAAGAQFLINGNLITIGAADTAIDLVNNINAAMGIPAASLNGQGALVLNVPDAISITDLTLGAPGIAALGHAFGLTAAQNPSFTVQVGTQAPVIISVSPADTAATLLASLNVIPGLTATLGAGGELVLTPTQGGDIRLLNVVGAPLNDLGMTVTNVAHAPFRTNGLGPDGSISTGLLGNATLEDLSRSIMTTQAEDGRAAAVEAEKEESFLAILDKRKNDNSGVSIDQEMSEMIRIQSTYAAAARIVTVSERMLDELLNTVGR